MAIAPDWAHPTPRCTRLEAREAPQKKARNPRDFDSPPGVEISTKPVPPLPFANKGRDPRTIDPQVISFLERWLPKPSHDGPSSRIYDTQ
jgi:hypothetical protein